VIWAFVVFNSRLEHNKEEKKGDLGVGAVGVEDGVQRAVAQGSSNPISFRWRPN